MVKRQLLQLDSMGVILSVQPLIGRAKRKEYFIKSSINGGIHSRSTRAAGNDGAATVTLAYNQIHAQLSPWRELGVFD